MRTNYVTCMMHFILFKLLKVILVKMVKSVKLLHSMKPIALLTPLLKLHFLQEHLSHFLMFQKLSKRKIQHFVL